jgi:hypothetical protein
MLTVNAIPDTALVDVHGIWRRELTQNDVRGWDAAKKT